MHRLHERAVSSYNWSGFVSVQQTAARFARDGFLGADDGQLLVETADGEAAGTVGYRAVDRGTPPHSRCWSIGVTLLPELRGQGLGSAAQRELAGYLFATTAVNRIEADTDVTNTAEQRALAAAGFRREGVLRGASFRDGGWHDLVMFGRLRSDMTPGHSLPTPDA